jgi:aspartate/methionine/tyrosine aminotransferase
MSLRDFDLEVYFAKWEHEARHNLASSNPQPMMMKDLLALADQDQQTRFENLSLAPVSTLGSHRLREKISSLHEVVSVDDIICFAGAEEGIYTAMRSLLERDDHCLVITPNYQAAESIPEAICDVTGIPLDPVKNWALDLQRLKDAIRSNTKLVYINFPHNPTGKLLKIDELKQIVSICDRNGIYLFSDEVFRLLEYNDHDRLPVAADMYPRALSLNVTSKSYGLPGLRVGWIACQERRTIEKMEKYKHYLSICNSTPSEILAEIAVSNTELITSRHVKRIKENLELVELFMGRHREVFDWFTPDAGCIAFPKYLGPTNAESFVERARKSAGVFMLPPSVFRTQHGQAASNNFRIGFGREGVDMALAALSTLLANATSAKVAG